MPRSSRVECMFSSCLYTRFVPQPECYRQAASILLLRPRPSGAEPEFLLVHKPRKNDAWQLPQGGMEIGETISECALRELEEEAGITEARVIGESAETYKYDFPSSYRRFRPDNVCGQEIHFVFAVAEGDPAITLDGKEVDDHVWVDLAALPQYVRRKAYRGLVERLYDEAMSLL